MLKGSKYIAKLGGKIVVSEAATGALMATIPCEVAEGEESGNRVAYRTVLFNKDGEPMEKNMGTLKKVFGWSGHDPFWLSDASLEECRFEIVGAPEKFTNENGKECEGWKVKWLNPVGGNIAMPEPADRKSVLVKYGAKFRALAGSAPSSPTKPATPPAAKPTSKPTNNGPVSTKIECWEALGAENHMLDMNQLEKMWFDLIKQAFGPDADSEKLNQFQWGKLKAKIVDNVDF